MEHLVLKSGFIKPSNPAQKVVGRFVRASLVPLVPAPPEVKGESNAKSKKNEISKTSPWSPSW